MCNSLGSQKRTVAVLFYQELEELEDRIDEFESIMNTARTIQDKAKDIEDDLNGMERAIMRRLHRVRREVGIEA